MKKKKEIFAWSGFIGWMIFIFYMSNQPAEVSSAQSGFVINIIERIGIKIDPSYIDLITTVIRKGAHLTEYAILALLGYNVFKIYWNSRKAIVIALIVVVLYASSDELHQTFVSGRAGRITDVFIDSIGGSVGILLMCIKNQFINKQN